VVLVILLVLFTGLLWLLGLMCGRERRRYVADLSRQAMDAISTLLHDPARSALGVTGASLDIHSDEAGRVAGRTGTAGEGTEACYRRSR